MKQVNSFRLMSAVFMALPVLGVGSTASAQYRTGDDGHALDANPRVGSGGYNSGANLSQRSLGSTASFQNNVVYGTVTGLNYFHGNLGETDPNLFAAQAASSNSDRFNAISGPVNYDARDTGAPTGVAYVPTAQLNTAPPANFTTTNNGTGLIPSGPLTAKPNDTRLGIITSPTDQTYLSQPGDLNMPGPVDASGNASTISMSPLFGVRDLRSNDPNDMYFLSKYSSSVMPSPSDRTRLDDASIQRMRNELNGNIVQGPNGQTVVQTQNPNADSANANANQLPSDAAVNGAALNNSVSAQPLNSNLNNGALNGNLATASGMQQQPDLPPPPQQSTQLAELQSRRQKLLAQAAGPLNPMQETELHNEEQIYRTDLQKQKDKLAQADQTPLPAAAGNAAPVMGANAAAPTAKTPAAVAPAPAHPLSPVVTSPLKPDDTEQPFIITSLATGVRSPGMAELLKSAEDQMRQGKFNEALDTYDSAQQVAPNNPFITLGRGFAELGASTYGLAEANIRRSIATEPALLEGRYDLRGFLGQDRLQFVTKDLQDIFQSEKKSEQAAFLLAYVAHNNGDDAQAATYLDAAQQRGGDDAVLKDMRKSWGIAK